MDIELKLKTQAKIVKKQLLLKLFNCTDFLVQDNVFHYHMQQFLLRVTRGARDPNLDVRCTDACAAAV